MTLKQQEVYRIAHELFSQEPDWIIFFREVLGLDGVIHQAFPQADQRVQFERTEEYAEIQNMLAQLREQEKEEPSAQEPTRVITIRLPRSLHESLRAEAHERRTSMNRLCIAKLLKPVDEQLIPGRTAASS